MRYLLAIMGILVTGIGGGVLGWVAGLAMDRYRWLGLGPEEFWRTDPENVWTWGFIMGWTMATAVSIAVSVRRLHRWTQFPKPEKP
ncbi:MAG: hypothetical protein ACKV0T_28495 [Planctomycetales bacterium]